MRPAANAARVRRKPPTSAPLTTVWKSAKVLTAFADEVIADPGAFLKSGQPGKPPKRPPALQDLSEFMERLRQKLSAAERMLALSSEARLPRPGDSSKRAARPRVGAKSPTSMAALRAQARANMRKLADDGTLIGSAQFIEERAFTKQALSKAEAAHRVFFLDVDGERYFPAFFCGPSLRCQEDREGEQGPWDIAGVVKIAVLLDRQRITGREDAVGSAECGSGRPSVGRGRRLRSGMSVLKRPPPSLKNQPLPTIDVDVARLFRISFYTTGEPFHGNTASKRFDDPFRTKSKRFGTCYMGFSLECAIAETVLHDLMPVKGVFKVAVAELASRYVVRFSGTGQLRLADLTGANLKTTVDSSEISTVFPYDIPQAWAKALHAHPADVDGIPERGRCVRSREAQARGFIFRSSDGRAGRVGCNHCPASTTLSGALTRRNCYPN